MWILLLVLYTVGTQTVSAPTIHEIQQFNSETECTLAMSRNRIVAGGSVDGASIKGGMAELHVGYLCVVGSKTK
jgi:hypothetical protein